MTAAWKQAILVLLPTHTHSAALSCHNIHRHRRTDAGLGCGAGTGAKTKLSGASQSGTKIHLTTTTFSTTSTANSAGFASFHTLAFSQRERASELAKHPNPSLVGVDGPLSGSFDSSQNYCESHRFIAVVVHLQKIQSHTMSIVVIAQIKCTLQTICSAFDSVTVDNPMSIWENIETLLSLNYAHCSLSPCGNGQLNK